MTRLPMSLFLWSKHKFVRTEITGNGQINVHVTMLVKGSDVYSTRY